MVNYTGISSSSSKYLKELLRSPDAVKYELVENYRSKNNLVQFSNQYVTLLSHRLKITPIIAKDPANGTIRITRHHSGNLIHPLAEELIQAELTGTTCVLTTTNEQALQIASLIGKHELPVKLIQSNNGFDLFNIIEMRYFVERTDLTDHTAIIDDDTWTKAKRDMSDKFKRSTKLDLCLHVISTFESIQTKRKYKSDLKAFLMESKLEDFFKDSGETILVSTIHKAKGREFDNVFILLEDFKPTTDEAKRQLYVAMTRAKQNLTIHLNGTYLDNITAENLQRVDDPVAYAPPNELLMHLTHRDVQLGDFASKQQLITQLMSGDDLKPDASGCQNSAGQSVLKFSQKFKTQIDTLKERGYELKSAKVNFIVYWYNEGLKKEYSIVLPEVGFLKQKVDA